MVPGSTLMYGSSFIMVTLRPRASRIAAREAEAIPLPKEETTPPVTNMYRVMYNLVQYESVRQINRPTPREETGWAFVVQDGAPEYQKAPLGSNTIGRAMQHKRAKHRLGMR